MTLLLAGVALWSVVHLFPSLMPTSRAVLIGKLGNNAYRGLFALSILVGLVLIVVGWRSAELRAVYSPPLYGSLVIPALMLLSFVLFAAANTPNNIKRLIRHPMLTGMIVWSAAHLLANGDSRSIALFAGLGVWALISIITISRRDRVWEKPAAVTVLKDVTTLIASAALFAVVLYFHGFFFGVPAVAGTGLS